MLCMTLYCIVNHYVGRERGAGQGVQGILSKTGVGISSNFQRTGTISKHSHYADLYVPSLYAVQEIEKSYILFRLIFTN